MATRGDVQTATFFTIGNTPLVFETTDVFASTSATDCCLELPVFASLSDTDPLKNDRTSFWKPYDNSVTAVVLKLQKCVNGASVTQATISDDTYGTFIDFGTTTAGGKNFIALKSIDWTQILTDFGVGTYRLKTEETNLLASVPVQNQYSFTYKLMAYNADRVNGTVFFTTTNSAILGNINNQKETITFPDDWTDGIRIPGRFGDNKSDYEEERTRYNDGYLQVLTDDQTESYILETDRLTADVHNYFKTEILQADSIKVTDYNADNANCTINKYVKRNGEYSPTWAKGALQAKVIVEFGDAYDNQRKRNC